MSPRLRRGLIVAAVHVAIVASLGVKLRIDRATRPRVWARAAPVDPNLPIRGRYVSLRIEAAPGLGLELPIAAARPDVYVPPTAVALQVANDQLIAVPPSASTNLTAHGVERDGRRIAVLDEPLAYFIPEHGPDPSRRPRDEELWVEVTIPRAGPPRPIRLGVKKNGLLTPLVIE